MRGWDRWSRPDSRVAAAVAAFWAAFALVYPYRELIDDTRYEAILLHRMFFIDAVMRPLHSSLLYVVGDLGGGSLRVAMAVNLVLHLAVGLVADRALIPRMPEAMRVPARLGLLGFLLHPVSLQTVVHVAQGSEVLGALFVVSTLAAAVRFVGPGAPAPSAGDFVLMGALAVGALLSKENSFPPLLLLIAALAWSHRSRAGRTAVLILVPTLAFGALSGNFSRDVVRNQANYDKSRAFRRAVVEGRVVAPGDSLILPLRDPAENLWLQTALVPLLARVTLLPLGLVKDYGHFPYGKRTYSWRQPWFWLGLALLLASAAAVGALLSRRRAPGASLPPVAALLLAPGAYYAVYFVFTVYDPLFLYRLYGAVLLLFVAAVPALALAGVEPSRVRAVAAALAVLAAAGGLARAWEMRDPLVEASAELRRAPDNYRAHVALVRALGQAGRFPLDCRALLEPALALAPSAALIHVEWAWCHRIQGRLAEARAHALASLEYESVPENVRFALQYVVSPEGVSLDPAKVHPSNLPVMLGK